MYGTHLSLTAVHTILRENDEVCVAGGGAWRPCYLNTQSAVSALDHGTFCISLHTFFLWPDHCQANLIYLTLHCNIELEMRSRVVLGYNLNV